jgi:Fe-S oxidoreductase/FAD/FMN-containing dehydrogenase
MAALQAADKRSLESLFRTRVSFDRMERTLYGHDIAEIPSLIKPLVGSTVPEAVVQPASEEELVALVRWAQENRIALTPRGRASSGYGGVLPVKGGLVVDFFHLSKLLEIDTKTRTARVQPGICWEKLDRELAKKDLTLRLYPSSYPAATVGGWLAQGGAGFGSYESGWFRDNVVSARGVLADGAVREFSGSDLDLVSEAEGTTGLISEVTVKVMPKEGLGVISIGCPDAYDLQRLVERIVKDGLPIWSLSFINPRMAEMKNRAPLRMHAGHAVGERVLLPASYVMTLAFREKDRQRIDDVLPDLFKTCQAELLSDKVAHHEWDNRFEIMVVKRLGPSLVPAEVVIPLSSLGDMMAEVERKVSQPVVKEGLVIREGAGGNPEVVILGFIPSDQRKLSYNFIFPLSLTIMKIAEKNGGRPYATGLYFAGKASQILGRERLGRLKAFKARVDPSNILNPGKVMQGGLMASALSLGAAIEPLIRPLGNHVISKIGERPTQSVRDIPADVAWYAYTCSQCGYCVAECDQFYGRGWESQSPRGKWYWLREYMAGREQWDQQMVDTFLVCTTCEMCDTRCSTNLPIEPSWMKLRGMLINEEQRMTFPPFEMMAAALKSEGNIWAGYRKDRMDWYPADLKAAHPPGGKAKNVYFAGCTASYVEHDIGQASVRLLDKAGVDFVHLGKEENCCGTPMLVAGRWDLFAEIMKRNIELVKQAGADTVIASCPACDMMWRQYYPEWAKKLGIDYPIKARHYSEILAEQIKAGKFRFPKPEKPVTVTWHDSCHIGRASGVYEPPRDVIQAIPNVKLVEMSHNREQAHCCASVLTLLKEPPVAADIGKVKLDEALAAGAEKILSLCPCCQVQLRVTADKKGVPIEVQDLAHFAAATFGYTFPDPNPEVRKQWAVFDAFIKLLTPQGFADLMGTMWPELIDAMPRGMGRMMRLLGKVPGALSLMKPMFPVLFPRLLPLMLPKVLATMLRRVEEQIEMPKYMREQMPDLMPKVMDRLMPHMIGDVVPLITQPMIDYLRGKS